MDFVTDTCEVYLLATVFSLTLLAAMQSYWNRKVFTVRKVFDSHRIGLAQQHGTGRRFIALEHR